jgi:AraC-like DNA-binding protein
MDIPKGILGECRTYSDLTYTHDHIFAQLILPLQGTLFIETSSHHFELDDSRLFFLPPKCQHTFYANNNNEFLVLDIPSFMLASDQTSKIQGGLSTVLDDRWQAIRFLMLSEVSHQSTANQDLTNLFHYAYKLLLQDYRPRSLQYIHANYHESLEVQKLADLEGYNLTYYCEWFKKLTGVSPKSYIQKLRLKKAKELLEDTNLSIFQIAQQVGYEHHSSLTRLFQHYENVTPLAYRQQTRRLEKREQKFS